MLKKKKQPKKEVEQEQKDEEEQPSFKELLENEYDNFASAPTMGSPDHGLSIFIKLHQVVGQLSILINEIKLLRQDVNNETPANDSEENKEIY